MWNAFGSGSGLLGGSGSGYVGKAQGWEFVPCSSRLERERGRGKSRSPLRALSSPIPMGHFYEQHIPGLGAAAASESTRGLAPRNELQTQQHSRLKKKIDDLKKRHGQDREEWMREKEVLLRQMADIQGGENRRILLDLKSILDDVQLEVKREETKRSELQLQYMKDRCAWELERAELKCRIAQLEVRERGGTGTATAEATSMAAAGKVSQEQAGAGGGGGGAGRGDAGAGGGGGTLRREQQEQRRLLADTHTVAMDLRCRLEHNERGWVRERSELLERFDLERREWESQLRDMQRKIEELYSEVKGRREMSSGDVGPSADVQSCSARLSLHSASTGSSLLTDQSDARSSSLSDSMRRHSQSHSHSQSQSSAGGGGGGGGGGVGDLSSRLSNSRINNSSSSCGSSGRGDGAGTHIGLHSSGSSSSREDRVRTRGSGAISGGSSSRDDRAGTRSSVAISEAKAELPPLVPTPTPTPIAGGELDMDIDTAELENILQSCLGTKLERHPSLAGQESLLNPFNDLQSMDIRCGTDTNKRKKNTIALNAALNEIAKVSEELCSYQDEIRWKSDNKRGHAESLYFPDELERMENERNAQEMEETFFSLKRWCKELQDIDEQNWISPRAGIKDTNQVIAEHEIISPQMQQSPEAPPVPPRSTSWYMNSPPPIEPEFCVPEPRVERKCPSPCGGHMERGREVQGKCPPSPSIVRRFEAMLQENEGKVLTPGGIMPCPLAVDSKCNIGCCHSRWSCDGSKFGSSKSSTYVPVQKCLSELTIPTTGVDYQQDHRAAAAAAAAGAQKPPVAGHPLSPLCPDLPLKDTNVDTTRVPSLDLLPTQDRAATPRRNTTLEQKTAEFNRTLFQAEMGRGFNDQDDDDDQDDDPDDMSLSPEPQQPQLSPIDVNVDVLTSPYADMDTVKPESRSMAKRGEPKFSMSSYIEEELERVSFDLPSPYHEASLRQAAPELIPQHPVVRVRNMIHPSVRNLPESRPRANTGPDRQTSEYMREREASLLSSQLSAATVTQHGATVTVTPIQSRNKNEPSSIATVAAVSETRPKQAESTTTTTNRPEVSKTRSRIFNENPWKPTTLAAYPRPAESRSNYGAIERILKSYESSSQTQSPPPSQTPSASPSPAAGREDDLIQLMDMLEVEHHTRSGQRLTHTTTTTTTTTTTQRQATTHKETHVTVQKGKEPGMSSRRSFSRPACPANRRLPSRWASSRSPSASSTTSSSSTSSSPITQLAHGSGSGSRSGSMQRQSFSYAASFHTETIII